MRILVRTLLWRVTTLAGFCLTLADCGGRAPDPSRPPPDRTMLRMYGFQAVEHYTEASRIADTLPAAPVDVWAVMPAVYQRLGVPVSDTVPSLMELGNPGYRARRVEGRRMGSYVDCGTTHSGTLANLYEITLAVVSRVARAPEGGTVLTTTLDAWGRQTATSGNPVHCSSKGELEARIVALVGEMLGLPGA